jgi:hypothetical protein
MNIRTLAVCAFLVAGSVAVSAQQSIRIHPKPLPTVDGSEQMLVKRFPAGGEFVLTVNKGQDVTYFQIQWFKDGQPIPGETAQELRRPVATEELEGQYTVQMTSPCATVMSKPTRVIVGNVPFPVTSEVGTPGRTDEVAGLEPFELRECQPNPVSDKTTITFTTRVAAPITLHLIDIDGRIVATLANEHFPAGKHDVVLNTREHDLSNSMYFYVMQAPGFIASKPLIIVR